MIKKIVFLIFLCISGFGLFAQIYVEEKAIYDEAEEYLDGEEFEEALSLYNLLEKREIENSNISYKIGLCYLNLEGRKLRSIPYLENAVQNVSEDYSGHFEEFNAPVEAWLLLGQAYHIETNLENARLCFNKIQEISQDSALIRLAKFYLSRTDIADLFLKNPVNAKIEVLNDNSAFSVYNPLLLDENNLVLMERRKFYDALITCKLDSNTIKSLNNITPMVGSDGNIFLCGGSSNGKMLIYTGYNAGEGYDLYYSEKLENGSWSKYQRFPEPVNSPYNETSASLSGKTLYFTSNRKGTFGGEDIFVSTQNENGDWSEPKNLGRSVNSIFDESNPFISEDNTLLFFCSKGHLNMGGFDLFYSKKNKNNIWSLATNMGTPFSTTSDDKFFSKKTEETTFFTTRYNSVTDEKSKINKITLSGTLPGKKVVIRGNLNFTDSLEAKSVNFTIRSAEDKELKYKTSSEGQYALLLSPGNYTLNFEYHDNVIAEQSLNIDENQPADELILTSPVWKFIGLEEPIYPISSDKMEEVTLVYIKDILFDFNSTILNNTYYPMLDSLIQILKTNQKNRIVIIGHTDAVGDVEYNLRLSQKRAESVAEYFRKKNVGNEQFSFKGKGENEPVALNFFENGQDNPKGRKFNRRVEIQLITTERNIQVIYIQSIPEELKLK